MSKTVSVTSTLLDKVNVELFAACIANSSIETVRFSQAALDVEMTKLVAEATSNCQVRTLHLDWNPIEVALGDIPMPEGAEAVDGKPPVPRAADIDTAERTRRSKQEKREIYHFNREVLKRAESMADAVANLKSAHAEGGEDVLERREWVPTADFVGAFEKLGLAREDLLEAADVLDGPFFGTGDGGILLPELATVCATSHDDVVHAAEANGGADEIGAVFASFLKGSVEKLSFRSCRIGFLELPAITKALAEGSRIQQLNLWGNRLDDECAQLLADSLLENHALQYLGLGQNRLGNGGLAALGAVCGMLCEDPTDAQARIKDQEAKKADLVKKKDPAADHVHVDELIEMHLPGEKVEGEEEEPEPVVVKVWVRNTTLRTIDLTQNNVTDRAVVDAMQPWGYKAPALLLKDNPVQESIRKDPCPAPAIRPEVSPDLLFGWAVDCGPGPKPRF